MKTLLLCTHIFFYLIFQSNRCDGSTQTEPFDFIEAETVEATVDDLVEIGPVDQLEQFDSIDDTDEGNIAELQESEIMNETSLSRDVTPEGESNNPDSDSDSTEEEEEEEEEGPTNFSEFNKSDSLRVDENLGEQRHREIVRKYSNEIEKRKDTC